MRCFPFSKPLKVGWCLSVTWFLPFFFSRWLFMSYKQAKNDTKIREALGPGPPPFRAGQNQTLMWIPRYVLDPWQAQTDQCETIGWARNVSTPGEAGTPGRWGGPQLQSRWCPSGTPQGPWDPPYGKISYTISHIFRDSYGSGMELEAFWSYSLLQ